MRHGFANKKLNRNSEHRKALLKNMLNSLIKYEQIKTTLPKAKFLKPQADKIITLGKKNNLTSTKNLISKLQDKKSANKVTKTLSKRYEKRSGGYTRIIKAGFRYGDNAPMAIIEFIDRDVEAKKHLRLALAAKSDFEDAKHMLSALEGITTPSAPLAYVKNLFDGYAKNFENSLLKRLENLPK